MYGWKIGHCLSDINTSGNSLTLIKKLAFWIQGVFTLWGRYERLKKYMLLTNEECLLVKPLGGHGTNVVGTNGKNLVFAKNLVLWIQGAFVLWSNC